MLKKFSIAVTFALLLFGTSARTFAQENATLAVAVADPTGAFIPGADVTATNDTTGIAETGVTNAAGGYTFTLQPGTYTITAEMPGFQTGIESNVALGAGQQVLRDFTLEIGVVATTITVERAPNPDR